MFYLINKWFPKETVASGSESESSEILFLAFEKTDAELLVKKNTDAYIPEKSLTKRDCIYKEGEGASKESRHFPTSATVFWK